MDKGKDPCDKSWNYDELAAAIKKHGIDPVDPAELVRTQMAPISGKINEIMRIIEEFLDTLENSSQGIDTTSVEEGRKKVAQEMFNN